MKKFTITAACILITALLIPCSAFAKLKIPRIFGHRMVLQRGREKPVWGQSDPEARVTITIADQTVKTRANKKGYWHTNLTAYKAGRPYTRDEKAPDGFELAEDYGKFSKVKARIDGNTITVSRKDLPNPTKVRFGWNGRFSSNLINKEGLPARPFGNTSAANTGDGK